MTVRELVRLLMDLDQRAEVYIRNDRDEVEVKLDSVTAPNVDDRKVYLTVYP